MVSFARKDALLDVRYDRGADRSSASDPKLLGLYVSRTVIITKKRYFATREGEIRSKGNPQYYKKIFDGFRDEGSLPIILM